ncbi:hypothetical protein Taro_029283 [Colocasia esculenta]|uniref:Uncharacterized protein n=1 Tax=Colocasia esculenta TaxID=4460 RepID=A0A843VDF7_COLES|nr:hypothetical protein [Colocasia esculenta]
MVPLMTRWEVAPDPRVMDHCVEDVRARLDIFPHDLVVWTSYQGEADTSHPTVAAGHPLFDRHVLLLCLGTYEPIFLELVVRTLGWYQPALEVPSLGREGYSRRRFFAEDRDLSEEHDNTSEAVSLLEGRLAEQAVEMERLHTKTRSLREELARVRVSQDMGTSSSAQLPNGDLAVRLQEALDWAEARNPELETKSCGLETRIWELEMETERQGAGVTQA